MMVCLPWFRKVREVWPEVRVGIVVSRRNRDLLKHESGFNIILYGKDPFEFIRSLHSARQFGADAVVDTRMHYDSTTTFIYGSVSGAAWMLSADNRDRRLPYNVRVPMPQERTHNSEMTRLLLSGLGREIPDRDLEREVRLSSEELEFAARFWRMAGLRLRGRTIGINMSVRDPLHAWPPSRIEELSTRLAQLGHRVVLFSMPSEREASLSISGTVPGTFSAPPTPTILHAAALIKDMAMFITPDTGLVHVASSYGIPTVGLYVPNEEHLPLWLPWRVENEVIMEAAGVGSISAESVIGSMLALASRTGCLEMD